MAAESQPSPEPEELEAAVDAAIATCDGDPRATIRSLIVANGFLEEHNRALVAELDYAWRWISPGYTRSTNRRRMNTGEPD
jgi:hypothetical protein